MRIFNHEGCKSGQCICRAIADKDRYIIVLSDPKNAKAERNCHDVLVREYDRLMDEQEVHNK